MASRDEMSLLWNQAAGSINLEFIGRWRIGILEDTNNRLDEDEITQLQALLEDTGGRFGDRRCELTVIGDKGQVDAFANALKECFLSEEEIQNWQQATEF